VTSVAGRIRRVLRTVAAAIGFLLYIWYAAVRHAPGVQARKAERRRRRLIERDR
jgi:hypothetical protein